MKQLLNPWILQIQLIFSFWWKTASDEAASDDAASDDMTSAASDDAASDDVASGPLDFRSTILQEQLYFRSGISSGAAWLQERFAFRII